jgi:hypothetical protein
LPSTSAAYSRKLQQEELRTPTAGEQKLNRMFESNWFTTGSATMSILQQAVQEVKEHRALLEEAAREF